MKSDNKDPKLNDLGFPVYAVASFGKFLFVAGGGGSSRTGVKNSIAAFKETSGGNFDYVTSVLMSQEEGAVANLALYGFTSGEILLAAGTDDFCQIISFDGNSASFKKLGKLKTVEGEKQQDPHQKAVQFVSDSCQFATLGSDSKVQLWNCDTERMEYTKAGECTELKGLRVADINSVSEHRELLIVSANSAMFYRNSLFVKKWEAVDKVEYRCGALGRGRTDGFFFVGSIDSKGSSCIERIAMDIDGFKKKIQVSRKRITSLCISDDGEWVSYGTNDGVVGLIYAVTLNRCWFKQSHSISVTSLSFSSNGKYLFSGSVDQQCHVHQLNTIAKKQDTLDVMRNYILIAVLVALLANVVLQFAIVPGSKEDSADRATLSAFTANTTLINKSKTTS